MKRTIQEWREFFQREPREYHNLFVDDLLQDMEDLQQKGLAYCRLAGEQDTIIAALEGDAQRYRYIVERYTRYREWPRDGHPTSWHLNSPSLGKLGALYQTFDEALDADIVQHRTAATERKDVYGSDSCDSCQV